MKSAKIFNLIGVVLGIAIIVLGFYVKSNPPSSYSTTTVLSYTFGADFYTEQYAATRAAATNASVTANNIRELGHMVTNCFGFAFMIIGALTTLAYLKKLICENNSPQVAPTVQSYVAPESTNNITNY